MIPWLCGYTWFVAWRRLRRRRLPAPAGGPPVSDLGPRVGPLFLQDHDTERGEPPGRESELQRVIWSGLGKIWVDLGPFWSGTVRSIPPKTPFQTPYDHQESP